jgi:hypothetical protein
LTIITEKILEDILTYLKSAMNNLAKEALENLELEGGIEEMKNFLEGQFDVRLENLLIAKNSSIHHLESSVKNKIIQRKNEILNEILKEYKIR